MSDDLEGRVIELERQLDVLQRGIRLILASVGPGVQWMAESLTAHGDSEGVLSERACGSRDH